MKSLIGMAVLVGILSAETSIAETRSGFGLGVMVGEPTGLSLKRWVADDRAMAAGLGWSFSGDDSLDVHMDYLFHHFGLFDSPEMPGRMPLHFGFGGRLKFEEDGDDDVILGVRVPVGISYLFAEQPMDLFGEIVPIVDLLPDTDLDLSVAVGVRFCF